MDSNQGSSTVIEIEPSTEQETQIARTSLPKRGRPRKTEKSPKSKKSKRSQPRIVTKIESKPRGRPKSVHSWEKLAFIESLKKEKVINIACGEHCSFSVTVSGK